MPERRSLADQIVLGAASLYAAVLTCLSVLWQRRQMPWWAEVSNIFAAQLFWPLVLLALAAARSRDWWLRVVVAVPGALFVGLFWQRLRPRNLPTVAGRPLRVATYNLCFLNQDTVKIAAAICRLDADIVALQELTPVVAGALRDQLGHAYPFQALLPAEHQHGLGLLSRFPIITSQHQVQYRGQYSLLEYAGTPLHVFNVHPTIADIRWKKVVGKVDVLTGYNPGKRAEQIVALTQAIAATTGDVVLAGDFNTSDREPVYRLLAKHMCDSFGDVGRGFGFTFPFNFRRGWVSLLRPLVRIDYVWYRGNLQPVQAKVVQNNGGSDHYIVVADFVSSNTQALNQQSSSESHKATC